MRVDVLQVHQGVRKIGAREESDGAAQSAGAQRNSLSGSDRSVFVVANHTAGRAGPDNTYFV